jgi:outer membrane protein assembly factor BamB
MISLSKLISTAWTTSIIGALCATAIAQADWPQFQGPNRTGISLETGIARAWPEEGPRVLWTTSLAEGFAGPAIRDGEVYLLDRVDNKQDVLRCFDLATGEEQWTFAYDAPGEVGFAGSRMPPTVDENYIYIAGMMGDLHCVDRKTHKPLWHRNIMTDFEIEEFTWGVVQAPSLYKDLVVLAPQAANATIAAYNRLTGELVWQSEGFGLESYTTPIITTFAGVDQAVMVTGVPENSGGTGYAVGVSMADGSTLWTYDGWQCEIPIPYPTPLPGDRLFITGGYGAGSAMVQIDREGDQLKAKEIFKTDVCGTQIHPPILYEDHLYMNSNGGGRRDGMICLTLDGKVLWKTKRKPNFELGNLLMVDELIVNFDGNKGMLHLINPSPEGYNELDSAQIFEGHEMWAPMAISNGKLLLRNKTEMKCLDLRNP